MGWQIGVSRTYDCSLGEASATLIGDGLRLWLGELPGGPPEPGGTARTVAGTRIEVRSKRPQDRVRLVWQPDDRDHDATVQGRERLRTHWTDVAERLRPLLVST